MSPSPWKQRWGSKTYLSCRPGLRNRRAALIAQLVKNPLAMQETGPSLIPGLGRSAGEGIGYPLQYSWASLVAQLVKNLPAMRENWVWSLGWEDPLEKGTATHSSILAWRIPWTVKSIGSQRVGHNWVAFTLPSEIDKLGCWGFLFQWTTGSFFSAFTNGYALAGRL